MNLFQTRLPYLAAVLATAIGVVPTSTQTMGTPERFTAFAVSMGGIRTRAGAETVQITVKRWSTESERQRLIETLTAKGPNELLEVLRDMPEVGTIRTPDSLGYPLHFAYQRKLDEGGRRVVIATDRPIAFWEAVNRPRRFDYPFTLIDMNLGSEGTGEGRMSIATKIIAHDNVVELENYDTQPVMLNRIKAEPIR